MTTFYLKGWLGELIGEFLHWKLWLLMLEVQLILWFILNVKLEVSLANAGIVTSGFMLGARAGEETQHVPSQG